MTEVPPWFRGPLPGNVIPLARSTPEPAPAAAEPLLLAPHATYFKTLANGKRAVVNPNLCLVCHRRRHLNTVHHEFMPDEELETTAAALGWPMPSSQAPLLGDDL